MKKLISILCFLVLVGNLFLPSYSEEVVKKQNFKVNEKGFNTIKKNPASATTSTTTTTTTTTAEELIPVNVKNEFDEEIKVKLDTNREYPIGPDEWVTLGKRKPGRYTLTIYNKKGDFVDNLTKNIDNKNKFVLNEKTISNSSKITGLSTGQKVAVTAGAVGVAALGAALINKALNKENESGQTASQYVPPSQNTAPVVNQKEQVQNELVKDSKVDFFKLFDPNGKSFKFLNNNYPSVTVRLADAEKPIAWIIAKARPLEKPQPLMYQEKKITIAQNRLFKVLTPDGLELQRYAFELDVDSNDNSYVWVIR